MTGGQESQDLPKRTESRVGENEDENPRAEG